MSSSELSDHRQFVGAAQPHVGGEIAWGQLRHGSLQDADGTERGAEEHHRQIGRTEHRAQSHRQLHEPHRLETVRALVEQELEPVRRHLADLKCLADRCRAGIEVRGRITDELGRPEGRLGLLRVVACGCKGFWQALRWRLAGAPEGTDDVLGGHQRVMQQARLRNDFRAIDGAGFAGAQQGGTATPHLAQRLGPHRERLDREMHQVKRRAFGIEQQPAGLCGPRHESAHRLDQLGMQCEALRGLRRDVAFGQTLERAPDRLPVRTEIEFRVQDDQRLQRTDRRLQRGPVLRQIASHRRVTRQRPVDESAVLLRLGDHVEAQADQRIAARFLPCRFEGSVGRQQGGDGQPGQRNQQNDRDQRDLGWKFQRPHQPHAGPEEQAAQSRIHQIHAQLQLADQPLLIRQAGSLGISALSMGTFNLNRSNGYPRNQLVLEPLPHEAAYQHFHVRLAARSSG
ncbi:MAG: hypothetical protein V9G29_01495 [Burkholderiaceae bacterium]